MTYFVKEHGCNFEFIIWGKTNPPPFTNGHYLKDKEYCLYFWEQGVKLKGKYNTLKTVYTTTVNTLDKEEYLHPTIKDLSIIKNLINNSSEENDLVLDPFSGSGTISYAAKKLNRQYIGFEIEQKWYDISKKRLQGENAKGELNLFDIEYE